MKEKLNVNSWLNKYNNHEYDSCDYHVQKKAGWVNWECQTRSLATKTAEIATIFKALQKINQINDYNIELYNEKTFSKYPYANYISFVANGESAGRIGIAIHAPMSMLKYSIWINNGRRKIIYSTKSVTRLAEKFNSLFMEENI